MSSRRLPSLVAHADWSTSPGKRWMAIGRLSGSRCYRLEAPVLAGDTGSLLARLREEARAAQGPGTLLVGFDFPIGLPRAYAKRAGIERFLDVLPCLGEASPAPPTPRGAPRLGTGPWKDFYEVAATPQAISLGRPFYPLAPGGTTHAHLVGALGVSAMSDLLRRCDRNRPHRVDACSIFWTLGGKQVGRATISGWRDVLAPALRQPDLDVAIWLFDGELDELLRERDVVIVETYPAEACLHLGFRPPGQGWSKRKQADRRKQGEHLLAWARKRAVALSGELERQIEGGFGATTSGDDRFDAIVGLMSMVEVVLGHREPGAPIDDPYVHTVENWIFGQGPPPKPNDEVKAFPASSRPRHAPPSGVGGQLAYPLPEPRVRAARPGDEEAIDRLLEQLFAGHSDVRADPGARREALPRLIASDRLRVLVVEDDAGVVGMISLSFDLALRYAGEYAQIEELIIDPRGRGRHLGALLVRSAIAEARARGCREIGLYAREETRAFYEKLGFRYAGPEVRLPLG